MINNNTGENVNVPCWECLFWDAKTGKCGINKYCSSYDKEEEDGIAQYNLDVSYGKQK